MSPSKLSELASFGRRHTWGGFDFSRMASLNSDDTLLVPVSINVFTVPSNVTRAEISRLYVGGEPEALWYQKVSWLPIVTGSGAAEILARSDEPTVLNGGAAIPTPDSDVTVRNTGIRYVSYGSLEDPLELPVPIELAPNATFGIRIVSVNASSGTPFMVYVRALGRYQRS